MSFPVVWEDPQDEQTSWVLDRVHTPYPLVGISADYFMLGVCVGMRDNTRSRGLPMHTEARCINGYLYWGQVFDDPDLDRKEIAVQALKANTAWARQFRTWWDNEGLPALLAGYGWMRSIQTASLPLPELADMWDELWPKVAELWTLHFMATSGSYGAVGFLQHRYGKIFETQKTEECLVLVSGLTQNLQRMERDLQQLVDLSRASDKGFDHALDDFLAEHGHCGQPYDDIAIGSWADEPEGLLNEIRKRVTDPPPDCEERRRALRKQAGEFEAEVRAKLADRPDDLADFEDALALAVEAGPLTEDHNYWMDRMCHARVHSLCLRVGERLVAEGSLDDARDVFLIHADEVSEALRESPDLRPLVGERRALLERFAALDAPMFLGAPPDERERNVEPESPGTFTGIGVSPGTYTGPVRIVLSDTDFGSVETGDVILCRSSNPSWVPVFAISGALVTDHISPLAHSAVVAREFGIPAVADCPSAFEGLADGQMVEVDGTKGIVRLL